MLHLPAKFQLLVSYITKIISQHLNLVTLSSCTCLCHLTQSMYTSLQQNEANVEVMLALSGYNNQL